MLADPFDVVCHSLQFILLHDVYLYYGLCILPLYKFVPFVYENAIHTDGPHQKYNKIGASAIIIIFAKYYL